MKTIRYQSYKKMTPREGVKYATTYVIQTPQQREELVNHFNSCLKELKKALINDPSLEATFYIPMKGFPQTGGKGNRRLADIITDMNDEAVGKTRQGRLKDFALAPIERWNKAFEGTDYEINLVQSYSPNPNKFQDLFKN